MPINRYVAHPVVLSDRLEENTIDPVSSAPSPGTLGLPVYAVQGAGVQPTEDSADGVPASAPPAVAIQVAGSDGSALRVLNTDNTGKLNVNATFTGSAGNAAASATGAAVPSSADFLGADNGSGTLVGLKATANGLKVDGSAVVQPVSGTVSANATLSAETTKVIGTVNVASGQTIGIAAGSAVIGHVIVDSGAVTSITNAVTVVGAAASGATKSGNPVQAGGVFNTTQPTVTTGQVVEAQSTARGAQIVATGVDTFHVTVDSVPSTAVTNAGTFAVQATLSAETTKVIGTVNIAASQTVGIAAGSAVIGHVIVDTAPSTAVTNAGTFAVQQTPKTSGGMGLPFSASVNATKAQVKATAGNVYGWNIVNNTAAIAYCQVFNLASASVTVGTTVPDYVIAIPGNSTTGAGNTVALDLGISHSTGITIACTTTRGGLTGAACDVLFFFN